MAALERSALARTIHDSFGLTAGLSAVHAVGFTLIMGGALFANLRLAGALLQDRPAVEIVGAGTRSIVAGLLVSAVTGSLLFAPRATAAAGSGIFQIKMLLFVGAVAVQFLVISPAARRRPDQSGMVFIGALGVLLWMSLALAACAYILLE